MKIKLIIENVEIEVEGEEKFVKEEFEKLEEKYIGKNSDIKIKSLNPSKEDNISADSQECKYPSIRNLIIKQISITEKEWVLVHAFYKTNFGKNSFSREDILEAYKETNRLTDGRTNNLTNNLARLVKADYLTALNDKDFLITDKGSKRVQEILSGKPEGGDNE